MSIHLSISTLKKHNQVLVVSHSANRNVLELLYNVPANIIHGTYSWNLIIPSSILNPQKKDYSPWHCTRINPATSLAVIIIQNLVWRLHGCVYMDWQQHWEASTAGKQQTLWLIRGRLVGQAWCKNTEWLSYCHNGVPSLQIYSMRMSVDV